MSLNPTNICDAQVYIGIGISLALATFNTSLEEVCTYVGAVTLETADSNYLLTQVRISFPVIHTN